MYNTVQTGKSYLPQNALISGLYHLYIMTFMCLNEGTKTSHCEKSFMSGNR